MKETNTIDLENESLQLVIQKPGSVYRGARFDWTGQIVQITYKNKHTFCTTESLNPLLIDKQGRGLYNEFGIDRPVGYNLCQVGECFPKIGIGSLIKKSLKPYDFFEDYKISPYSFPYSVEKTKAQFFCEAENCNGYSFQLDKRIELERNTFTIHYTLTNSGKKEIKTNEYVHNFISINRRHVDEKYELSFPFEIKVDKLFQVVNPDDVLNFKDNKVTWNKPVLDKPFFVSNINTDYKGLGKWTLVNFNDGIGIQENTSFKVQKINLWGTTHVVSPELFFEINILPGQRISWWRMYTVFEAE